MVHLHQKQTSFIVQAAQNVDIFEGRLVKDWSETGELFKSSGNKNLGTVPPQHRKKVRAAEAPL